uniref:DP-Gal:betaGlcNAc beta 1,4- galactosyltransferase, polypeptide 1, like n=1 Tax=Neogobius melanostomus TaxID=47308 RepID=A0A8C6WIL9_9GOBI
GSEMKTCKLVVLLCFLHITVTLFFYVRSSDDRFAFAQNQQHNPRFFSSNNRWNQSLQTAGPEGTETGKPEEKKAPEPEKKAPEPEKKAPEPEKKLEKCPETSPLLVGPLRVEFMKPSPVLEQVKKDNPRVASGGRFRPPDCVALQKVAIIIPFRNRDEHLKYWLYYLHPILQRQQLDYGIYVINQVRTPPSSRENNTISILTKCSTFFSKHFPSFSNIFPNLSNCFHFFYIFVNFCFF